MTLLRLVATRLVRHTGARRPNSSYIAGGPLRQYVSTLNGTNPHAPPSALALCLSISLSLHAAAAPIALAAARTYAWPGWMTEASVTMDPLGIERK